MFKYAIIGFGGLGKLQLGNLLALEEERGDMKLVALCGADPASVRDAARAADLLELMEKPEIRLIVNRIKPKMVSAL